MFETPCQFDVMKANNASPNHYLKNLTKVLAKVKSEGLGKGKSGGQVSRAQQSLFAGVLNALGFYLTRYLKLNLDKTAMKSRQAKIMEDFKKHNYLNLRSVLMKLSQKCTQDNILGTTC